MSEQIEMPEESLVPAGIGPQLRVAREKLGLTIEQVAAETRIPSRHIVTIESGEFAALPGRTYAIGFSRSIARLVRLDQDDVVAMVRAELDAYGPDEAAGRKSFEPGDPTRAPSGRLVWFSLFAVVILVIGLYFAARTLFAPAAELPSLVAQQEQEEVVAAERAASEQGASAAGPAAVAGGPVVFTAQGPVWVRFYDEQRVLMEKEMAEGESYTIPADADGPQIITARPDLLAITIGGQSVPRLAEEMVTIQNVPVDAQSLLGRGEAVDGVEEPATGDEAG